MVIYSTPHLSIYQYRSVPHVTLISSAPCFLSPSYGWKVNRAALHLLSIAKRRYFFSDGLLHCVSPISGELIRLNALSRICSPAPCSRSSNSVFSSSSDLRCSAHSSISKTMSSNNISLSPRTSVIPEAAVLALTGARCSATIFLNLSLRVFWLGFWILSNHPSGDELRQRE